MASASASALHGRGEGYRQRRGVFVQPALCIETHLSLAAAAASSALLLLALYLIIVCLATSSMATSVSIDRLKLDSLYTLQRAHSDQRHSRPASGIGHRASHRAGGRTRPTHMAEAALYASGVAAPSPSTSMGSAASPTASTATLATAGLYWQYLSGVTRGYAGTTATTHSYTAQDISIVNLSTSNGIHEDLYIMR